MNKFVILIISIVLLYGVTAQSADAVKIMYHDRPPYMVFDSQEMVSGLAGFPTHKAFEASGISHFWMNIPPKRQLKYIQENKEKVCGVGWFKNAEREQYAKFTSPVYQDTVIIGFALAGNDKIAEATSLKDVFQNKNLILLVKQGYSYGKVVDQLIKALDPKRTAVAVDNKKALKMLNHKRVDYLLITVEEAYELTIGSGLKMSDYKIVYFEEVLERNKRYIMCSQKVENREIQKLNSWIDTHINIQ